MNGDELVEATRLMRRDAALILWSHAAEHCLDVNVVDVQALADALGDISIGEAIAAVDRLQADAQAARG